MDFRQDFKYALHRHVHTDPADMGLKAGLWLWKWVITSQSILSACCTWADAHRIIKMQWWEAMFVSRDVGSSRDRSQKEALAAPPLCLWATLIITELLYLPQVFPPVCRSIKTPNLNKECVLVLEEGTNADWREWELISALWFGPQNNLTWNMRDDAGGGEAKQRQSSDTRCMCNAASKPWERKYSMCKQEQTVSSERGARSRQAAHYSVSLLQSQPLQISSWLFLNYISEGSSTGRNRQARAVLGVGSFISNYLHCGYLPQNPPSASYLPCFLLFQLLRTLLPFLS